MPLSTARHARVLAIDDSPEFLAVIHSFFDAKPNFKLVATAQSGLDAVRLVEELHPDLVLMDLQMAGMNGLEATSEIRSRFPETQVVIITGYDIPGLRQICCDSGAADFVAKPRLNRELPDVLARFLAKLN